MGSPCVLLTFKGGGSYFDLGNQKKKDPVHNNPTSSDLQQSKHQFLAWGVWLGEQPASQAHFWSDQEQQGSTQKSCSCLPRHSPGARGHRGPAKSTQAAPLQDGRGNQDSQTRSRKARPELPELKGPFLTGFDCILTAKMAEPEPPLPFTQHRVPLDHDLPQMRRKHGRASRTHTVECKISSNNGCEHSW